MTVLRHVRSNRCPVCGGADGLPRGKGERCFGFTSEDHRFAHCTRPEFAANLPMEPNSQTFAHRLDGPCRCGSLHNGAATSAPIPLRGDRPERENLGPVQRFNLIDAAGNVVAIHCRQDFTVDGRKDKSMWYARPDGERGLGSIPRDSLPLYGLPRLLAAPADRPAILCEGELKSDKLQQLAGDKAVVVSPACGAGGTPHPDALRPLVGRDLYLWPDNDQEGRRFMGHIAASLGRLGAQTREIAWAGATRKGDDAADFVARGGTSEDLMKLLSEAKPIGAPEEKPGAANTKARLTDLEIADAILADHNESLRHCGPWGKWLVWDGRRWAEDRSGRALLLASRSVAKLDAQVHRVGRINAGLALAAPRVSILPEDLDRDGMLLNCPNGTADLRSMELRPHSRADRLTKLCPTPFDPAARAPLWDRFLERILPDSDVRSYVQRLIGYSVTGVVRDHVLPILYGAGANGKSTFLGVLRRVVGSDYAAEAAPDILMIRSGNQHPTERADLAGKRLITSIEIEDGGRLAESLVKQLTGGDSLKVRRMREDFWSVEPTWKIFVAANHRPEVRGTDYAMWRRIRLIPFTVTIPPEEQVQDLGERLIAEAPGILAWAVAGCASWQEAGLGNPPAVLAATEEYRTEADPIGLWLAERCVKGDLCKARAGDLYQDYLAWLPGAVGGAPATQTSFGRRLTEMGFPASRDAADRWRSGIGLKAK